VLRPHHEQVVCTAFSPDGTKLATASADQTIKLWDTRSWSELASLHGHDFEIWSIAFSPDGKRLISAAKDDTVRVWPTNPSRKNLQMELPSGSETMLISREGPHSTIAAYDVRTGGFTLGDLLTGKILLQGTLSRSAPDNPTHASLLGDKLVLGYPDGSIRL